MKRKPPDPDLEPHDDFDYSKAKPNRFAAGMKPGGRLVVLEPDVAARFATSNEVNQALRALMDRAGPEINAPAKHRLAAVKKARSFENRRIRVIEELVEAAPKPRREAGASTRKKLNLVGRGAASANKAKKTV